MSEHKYLPRTLVGVLVQRNIAPKGKDDRSVAGCLVLVGVGHLTYSHYCLIASETKSGAKLIVGPSLQGEPVEDTLSEGNLREIITGRVKTLYNREEGCALARLYLHYSGEFHGSHIIPHYLLSRDSRLVYSGSSLGYATLIPGRMTRIPRLLSISAFTTLQMGNINLHGEPSCT